MKELDKKDFLLLDILSEGSRNALSRASKELRLHKNSILYRIKRLKKLGVIRNFSFIPGYGALGKDTFYLFLRIREGKENRERIHSYLKGLPLAIGVFRLSGKWNYEIELACDNMHHFNNEIAKITDYLGEAVLDYMTVFLYDPYKVESSINFEKDYAGEVFGGKGKAEMDALDRKILGLLSSDSSLSYGEIAKKTDSTPDSVYYRIKKMGESGAIRKFVPIVDLGKAGFQYYAILLKLSSVSNEKLDSLGVYLTANRNINFAFRTAGQLGVMFFVAYRTNAELDAFLSDLQGRFGDAIREQDVLIVNERMKFDYYPAGLV
jgi:DNA-binding Lrp family transcriptional regulator